MWISISFCCLSFSSLHLYVSNCTFPPFSLFLSLLLLMSRAFFPTLLYSSESVEGNRDILLMLVESIFLVCVSFSVTFLITNSLWYALGTEVNDNNLHQPTSDKHLFWQKAWLPNEQPKKNSTVFGVLFFKCNTFTRLAQDIKGCFKVKNLLLLGTLSKKILILKYGKNFNFKFLMSANLITKWGLTCLPHAHSTIKASYYYVDQPHEESLEVIHGPKVALNASRALKRLIMLMATEREYLLTQQSGSLVL